MDADGRTVGAPSIVLERLPARPTCWDSLRIRRWAPPRDRGCSRRRRPLPRRGVERCRALACAGGDNATADRLNQILHWENVYRTNRLEPLPVVAALFSWLKQHARARAIAWSMAISARQLPLRGRTGHRPARLGDGHLGDRSRMLELNHRPLWVPTLRPLQNFVTILSDTRVAQYPGRPPFLVSSANSSSWPFR